MEIIEISTQELHDKLERQDDFKLVMTFHPRAFQTKHIPGSINVFSQEDAVKLLDPSDEIVLYCVNEACQASVLAYRNLVNAGFKNLYRYGGGLEAWEAAGYSFNGADTAAVVKPQDFFPISSTKQG